MRCDRAVLKFWALIALAGCSLVANAQAPQDRNAAVYMYRGADRDQRLLERARQEGSVVLYTSMATTESIPLGQAFEKKTGVKLQLWRALSEEVLHRTINEARGGRHTVDVIETNGPEVEAIAREQLTSEFASPHLADLPSWAIPSHRKWVSDRVEFFVVAFNTNKVKRSELPATYEGFLDPKWKGRMGIEATDQEWLAGIVKLWGEERGMGFFRKLVAMNLDMRKGHVLLAQLITSGEIPLGLTAYNANAESMKRRGGPIDWAPVEPLIGRPQGFALARYAPHPNAALLFADFVLSPEGAKLYDSMGRTPTNQKVKSMVTTAKYLMLSPAALIDEGDKWQRIWNAELLKK